MHSYTPGRNLLTNSPEEWMGSTCYNGNYSRSGSSRIAPAVNRVTIPVVPSTPMSFHVFDNTGIDGQEWYVGIHQLDKDLTFLNDSGWRKCPYTFTTLEDTAYIRLTVRNYSNFVENTTNMGFAAALSAIGSTLGFMLQYGEPTEFRPAVEDSHLNLFGGGWSFMILARNSLTVSHVRDIISTTWYYKLQASTASPPAKPTTATPSGWTTTEPTYTEGSTNSLYVCQKTTFSDGTFAYSDVSLSSSYEAAKTAYNKSVSALNAANGKNKNYYLPSNTAPTDPSAGDQWFQTDKGMELYRYDGSAWQKVGLLTSVFSTVEAGGATIGQIDSMLLYFNEDNYWNLSGADFDEDRDPTNVAADVVYKSHTLKTSHLIATDDVQVDGGPGSFIRIPVDNGFLSSAVEISNTGFQMISTNAAGTSKRVLKFPSTADAVHGAYIIHSDAEVTYESGAKTSSLTRLRNSYFSMVDTSWDSHGDVTWNSTLDFGTTALTGGVWVNQSNNFNFDFNYLKNRITFGAHNIDESEYTISATKTRIYFNDDEITPISEAYPIASGHHGACAVRVESGMATYMSLGVSVSGKTLYVYGSDNKGSLNYVGRVALI